MAKNYTVVVAGGGTAGHIEPALAVADELAAEFGVRVVALGTERGLEKELVPARGYELKLIDPVPVPRKVGPALFKLPFRVVGALRQTRRVLRETHADAVVGFGGYVSAPAYLAARSLGLPFFVHEANARAGLANKLGVWLGGTGLNAVSGSGMRGDVVGVPVRRSLAAAQPEEHAAAAREKWGLREGVPTVLVTGGSQGARSLNTAIEAAAPQLVESDYQILHAYGKKNQPPAQLEGHVAVPYIDTMDLAYAVADLVVCRAGAMTVAEVTAAGLPALYVPLPHGNGEQALNARPVIAAGGATMLNDADLSGQVLADRVRSILGDEDVRQSMVAATKASGLGQAAQVIATRVNDALHERK